MWAVFKLMACLYVSDLFLRQRINAVKGWTKIPPVRSVRNKQLWKCHSSSCRSSSSCNERRLAH